MSQRELTRLEVIQRVKRKTLKQRQAAELLSLSVRQVKRLCKAYQASGAAGADFETTWSAFKQSFTGEDDEAKRGSYYVLAIMTLGRRWPTEKLAIEGLSLSVETVRQLLIGEGLWKAKRVRRAVIHQLRERRARLGELVQIDGSPHEWFEGRAAKCTLLGVC